MDAARPSNDSEPSEIVNMSTGMGGRALVNAGYSIAPSTVDSRVALLSAGNAQAGERVAPSIRESKDSLRSLEVSANLGGTADAQPVEVVASRWFRGLSQRPS